GVHDGDFGFDSGRDGDARNAGNASEGSSARGEHFEGGVAGDAGRGGFGCASDAREQVAAGQGDSRVAAAYGDSAVLGGAASGSLSRVGAGVSRLLFGGIEATAAGRGALPAVQDIVCDLVRG